MSCGIVLPVSIVVHCCIAYLLKISAFAVKSNINMSYNIHFLRAGKLLEF